MVAAAWAATDDAILDDLRRRLGPVELVDDGPAADVLATARGPTGRRGDHADRPGRPAGVRSASCSMPCATSPWGETASYGEIARRVGAPRAARAVGGAVGRNPISLVIPCHRIIAADGDDRRLWRGRLGSTATTALARKGALLQREGVTVAPRPRVDSRAASRGHAGAGPAGASKEGGTFDGAAGGSMTAAHCPSPAPSMFAVFRRRDFSLLWLAQLISTAGSSLTDLAAGIYVYRETGSALAVGLTLMVTAIPSLVVGLLAGVFVDRHDRKRILDPTCLIQAVIVAAHRRSSSASRRSRFPGCTRCCSSTPGSSSSSTRRTRASSRRWPATRSWRRRTRSCRSPRSGRPPSGSPAPACSRARRPPWAFVIDAVTFLVCAACIALMGRYPMPKPEDEANVGVIVANLKSGIRHPGRDADPPRSLFIVGALVFFSFGLWNVLLLPFSIRELGATEFEYGLQEGLTSVGFVAGLAVHGALLATAARAALDRHRPHRHGHLPASSTASRRRSPSRSCWS